jgi:hypothetical protein
MNFRGVSSLSFSRKTRLHGAVSLISSYKKFVVVLPCFFLFFARFFLFLCSSCCRKARLTLVRHIFARTVFTATVVLRRFALLHIRSAHMFAELPLFRTSTYEPHLSDPLSFLSWGFSVYHEFLQGCSG